MLAIKISKVERKLSLQSKKQDEFLFWSKKTGPINSERREYYSYILPLLPIIIIARPHHAAWRLVHYRRRPPRGALRAATTHVTPVWWLAGTCWYWCYRSGASYYDPPRAS